WSCSGRRSGAWTSWPPRTRWAFTPRRRRHASSASRSTTRARRSWRRARWARPARSDPGPRSAGAEALERGRRPVGEADGVGVSVALRRAAVAFEGHVAGGAGVAARALAAPAQLGALHRRDGTVGRLLGAVDRRRQPLQQLRPLGGGERLRLQPQPRWLSILR